MVSFRISQKFLTENVFEQDSRDLNGLNKIWCSWKGYLPVITELRIFVSNVLHPNISTGNVLRRTRPPLKDNELNDSLKPKTPLSEEMSLEEANLWFKNYHAHLAYNKAALKKQEIQVQRAMLEVDLDSRMASVLRSHDGITDESKIDAKSPDVGCLDALMEIFLQKNPVWSRQ